MQLKKLLLPLLFITTYAHAQISFQYEKDLIEMYDHTEKYARWEREMLADIVVSWLSNIARDHLTGRIELTQKDKDYVERISIMTCEVLNWRARQLM